MEMKNSLSDAEKARYARQLLLPELGEAGQLRLSQAKVLIVGVGGLGSPIALYLAAAGIGTLGLVDADVVSASNLQRQVLYTDAEVGQSKVACAARRLKALNPDVKIETFNTRLCAENAATLIARYDVVVDGCDNFATRHLIDAECIAQDKPYVYGAIQQLQGQVSVFNYGPLETRRSYRDLYPDADDSELVSKAVMGVTPALVGSVEANEVLKIVAGYGEPLVGKLWYVDLRTMMTGIMTF